MFFRAKTFSKKMLKRSFLLFKGQKKDLVGEKLLVLQWNIQGSLQEYLEERITAIAAEIERLEIPKYSS